MSSFNEDSNGVSHDLLDSKVSSFYEDSIKDSFTSFKAIIISNRSNLQMLLMIFVSLLAAVKNLFIDETEL